ncbi:MAG: hypothetical protein K6C34_00050 [Alphaproteobacteria bacterium]|nr:hypothetical protein [Alphaproteobacteria bacterium]
MFKHVFNTKVKIESLKKTLSENNVWISEYESWGEIWASVSVKYISSKGALYLFEVKWKKDFPHDFRVIMNDTIFIPTQSPIAEPSSDLILFHATINK